MFSSQTQSDELKPLLAVDGATGYLGNHLVARLRQSGYPVRALVHEGAQQKDLSFLRDCGADIVVAALEKNDGSLVRALTNCSAAVHLIGSIAPRKGERLEEVHGRQTSNLAAAAKQAGVSKLVQVTALGTSPDAKSTYHTTKWQGEEHIRNSGCTYVILRPSLIMGRQVGSRESKLMARYFELIRTRPAVPVIGGGSNKIQPVFIGDLVAALERAIASNKFDNRVLEIGGPQVLTMREFVSKLIHFTGSKKQIRSVPLFAARIAAAFCETFQNVPLVSKDQIQLSTEDNICQDNALGTVFGITPTSIDEALQTYASSPSGLLSQRSV